MINWIKKHDILCKCIVVGIFPYVMVLCYLSMRGVYFGDLYLPNSYNNDSIFYYKTIEGILSYGMPRGYFGYNESRALIGSLGAWNPLIFLPWIICGKILGWSYGKMFFCNLFFFSISLVVSVSLARMSWKNIGCFMLFLVLFPSVSLHLLSGLPEIIMAALLCLYFGMAIRLERTKGKKEGIVLFILSVMIAVIRPYFIILLILPGIYLIKRYKMKGTLLFGTIILFTLLLYIICGHYFCAPYFTELFDLSIIKAFLSGNWRDVYIKLVACVNETGIKIVKYIFNLFAKGSIRGLHYFVAFYCGFFCILVSKFKKQHKISWVYVLEVIGLLLAVIFLLGSANTGSRHFFAIAVAGLFICSTMMENKIEICGNLFLTILLLLFIQRGTLIPDDYDIPVMDKEIEIRVNYWVSVFEQQNISVSNDIDYDNTIVWLIADWNGEEYKIMNHRELFALPKGMGISLCDMDYVYNNWLDLKSRYIATIPNGVIDITCANCGMYEVGRTDNVVIYRRY